LGAIAGPPSGPCQSTISEVLKKCLRSKLKGPTAPGQACFAIKSIFTTVRAESKLRSWNLNIGNNVRVAAFCVSGIHGSGCVAIIRSVGTCGICIGLSGIQRGTVDLRVGAAGAGVNCTVNVVSRNVRRGAGVPRQADSMNRSRRAGTGGRIRRRRGLTIAVKCQGGAVGAGHQRTVGHRKR
jgi:hypothetical protein